ncbi:hypothetical protein BJ944DRAFT_252455, partial [Cunninghamella echinulata]
MMLQDQVLVSQQQQKSSFATNESTTIINQLPLKYATLLNDQPNLLFTDEKKQLAIARDIFQNPFILLMANGELGKILFDTILYFRQGKTTITINHSNSNNNNNKSKNLRRVIRQSILALMNNQYNQNESFYQNNICIHDHPSKTIPQLSPRFGPLSRSNISNNSNDSGMIQLKLFIHRNLLLLISLTIIKKSDDGKEECKYTAQWNGQLVQKVSTRSSAKIQFNDMENIFSFSLLLTGNKNDAVPSTSAIVKKMDDKVDSICVAEIFNITLRT